MSNYSNSTIMQTHIVNRDVELRVLAEIEVDVPEGDLTTDHRQRVFALTTGGELHANGDPYRIANLTEPEGQCVIFPDRAQAIGYYLFGLEQHGVDESVTESLSEHTDISDYWEMQETITPRDRRMRLMNLWEYRVKYGDWAAERYFDEGASWRQTGLTEEGEELARRIENHSPIRHRQCYLTAGEAATRYIDNDRVKYVEGIAMPKQACQAVRHAWIEIDGRVAELTWPWHKYDGDEAVYIGVEIDKKYVRDTRASREINGAVVLTEEEVLEVGGAMRGDS